MEDVVGLDNVSIPAALWGRQQHHEPDMGASHAAGGLDVLRNVGWKTGEEHAVEPVNVDAVADR